MPRRSGNPTGKGFNATAFRQSLIWWSFNAKRSGNPTGGSARAIPPVVHDACELQHRSSSGNPIGGASTLGVRAIPPVELQRHSVRAIPRLVELQRKAFGHSHRWSFNAEALGQSHLSCTRHVSFNAAAARAIPLVELQC